MSFSFPRTISISRPDTDTGVGTQAYGGVQRTGEQIIATGISARIQLDQQGVASPGKLPADVMRESVWKILFKLPLGASRMGDVITDDAGNRYQVVSYYWGPMVTTCRCQILQT